jgi:hypothetical protein
MNNAEEMQERLPEMPPALRKGGMKRCYQCNGRFGLIRYRLALKAFCSKRCLNEYNADSERRISRIKTWADFLQKL